VNYVDVADQKPVVRLVPFLQGNIFCLFSMLYPLKRKNKRAAAGFIKKLMKRQGHSARQIVTDELPSYGAARKVVIPTSMHCSDRYANNHAELSHEHTRAQERQMRRFKSPGQVHRFLAVHSQIHNLFRVGRHILRASNYRLLRNRSFET